MFDLMSKPELKAGLVSTSSHATSGWLTWHLQSVDLPTLKKMAAYSIKRLQMHFPPFHYWNLCLKEQYPLNPTASLNFSSYLLVLPRLCLSFIKGIRAVFTKNQHALKEFIVFGREKEHDLWLSSKPYNMQRANYSPRLKPGVSFYPLNLFL